MSRILKEMTELSSDLHSIGLVSSKQHGKMKKLTARNCSIPEPVAYDGEQIIGIRNKLGCSQTVFAQIICVSKDAISKWETGERHPKGPALRVLRSLEREGLETLS
jgi:putative transcriptional regulator